MKRTIGILLWAGAVAALGLCGCGDGTAGSLGVGSARDASFTILLCRVGGPNHTAEAEAYRDKVAAASGWRDLYVVHKEEWSELYRGKYVSRTSADSDLKKAGKWRDAAGGTPFVRAMIMPLPPTQVGPPEWNLLRTAGMFTVAVAEFYDVPEAMPPYVGRRDFAVQCCRQLRSEGQEAYYYHGPVKSIVGIGSFPESAYPTVNQGGVLTRAVRDVRITAVLKKFPNLAVNGRQDVYVVRGNSGKSAKLATASYVMEIPRD